MTRVLLLLPSSSCAHVSFTPESALGERKHTLCKFLLRPFVQEGVEEELQRSQTKRKEKRERDRREEVGVVKGIAAEKGGNGKEKGIT